MNRLCFHGPPFVSFSSLVCYDSYPPHSIVQPWEKVCSSVRKLSFSGGYLDASSVACNSLQIRVYARNKNPAQRVPRLRFAIQPHVQCLATTRQFRRASCCYPPWTGKEHILLYVARLEDLAPRRAKSPTAIASPTLIFTILMVSKNKQIICLRKMFLLELIVCTWCFSGAFARWSCAEAYL